MICGYFIILIYFIGIISWVPFIHCSLHCVLYIDHVWSNCPPIDTGHKIFSFILSINYHICCHLKWLFRVNTASSHSLPLIASTYPGQDLLKVQTVENKNLPWTPNYLDLLNMQTWNSASTLISDVTPAPNKQPWQCTVFNKTVNIAASCDMEHVLTLSNSHYSQVFSIFIFSLI